jgi:hypothetical protein
MERLCCITSGIPLEQVTAAWRLSSESCIILILLSSLIYFKVSLIKMRISLHTDYTVNTQNWYNAHKTVHKIQTMLHLKVLIINDSLMQCDVMQFSVPQMQPAGSSEAQVSTFLTI